MRASLLTTTALAATLLAACSDPAGPEASPGPSVSTTAPPTASATPTPSPTTPHPTESTSAPAGTPTPAPTATDGCSSDGVAVPEAPADLPEEVLDTWLRIRDAAVDCDFAALARIATPRTTFSYGGGGVEVIERAEEHGDGDLGTLLRLLGLGHGDQVTGEGTSYAWPRAHLRESWDDTPRAERRELRAIHSAEEIASFAEYGHYLGWRLGIGVDGSWIYFVAGD